MKTVTLGELMLRLSPPGDERLFQSPTLRSFFGGAEANVAASLAHFGLESHYLTRLPDNPVGEAALCALRAEGIHTDHVGRGGGRLGIYFAELGAKQRPMRVIYDRAGSAASEMEPGSFDWPAIFAGASWFHTTGITPALGPEALATTRRAFEEAAKAGVTVSFDVNYRHQLWTPAEARQTLRPLMVYVDVLIANAGGLRDGLGVEGTDSADPHALSPRGDQGGETLLAGLADNMDLTQVAMTVRETPSASRNSWQAVLFERESGQLHRSRRYDVRMVDRVGAGDAFAAGLIYGLLDGRPAPDALDFAVAAGALKHTIPGDFNRVSVDEVERLQVRT